MHFSLLTILLCQFSALAKSQTRKGTSKERRLQLAVDGSEAKGDQDVVNYEEKAEDEGMTPIINATVLGFMVFGVGYRYMKLKYERLKTLLEEEGLEDEIPTFGEWLMKELSGTNVDPAEGRFAMGADERDRPPDVNPGNTEATPGQTGLADDGEPRMRVIHVVLPEDAEVGAVLHLVAEPSGEIVEIEVPEGHGPGDILAVEIPDETEPEEPAPMAIGAPSNEPMIGAPSNAAGETRRRSSGGASAEVATRSQREEEDLLTRRPANNKLEAIMASFVWNQDLSDVEWYWLKVCWGCFFWLSTWTALCILIGRAFRTPYQPIDVMEKLVDEDVDAIAAEINATRLLSSMGKQMYASYTADYY